MGAMHAASPFVLAFLLLAGNSLPGSAVAQPVVANYALTVPVPVAGPDWRGDAPLWALGPLRLAGAVSGVGSGLSLEAGRQWFARVGVGRGLAHETLSLGAGYRFGGDQSLSMQVTRQSGEERLGLAVRYEGGRSFLRLAYELPRLRWSGGETLRLSAGVKF